MSMRKVVQDCTSRIRANTPVVAWAGLGSLVLAALALSPAARAQVAESDQPAPPTGAGEAVPVQGAAPSQTPALDQVPPAKLGQQVPTLPPTEVPPAASATPETSDSAGEESESSSGTITLSGYLEAYYAYNFARPDNGITNNRWLDERHNNFTLQTVALDIAASKGPVSAKVTLMFGPTADRWYFEGAQIPAGADDVVLPPGRYSNETWKHIQTAYASYVAPLGAGLTISGGLMPTQVGFEGAAVKDNWNYSRSNLFNFLPFFHVGARVAYPLGESLTLTAAVYNGWNQASDGNKQKTLSLQTSYLADKLLFNLLYLGGIEPESNDAAGEPWRNLFDAVVQYDVLPMLSLGTNLDGGFARSELGTQSWFAAALYARAKAAHWLYFAVRGDGIFEQNAERAGEVSPVLLGGAEHILSATLTAEVRPIEGVSFRLEYRHDDSDSEVPLFYKRGFDADGNQLASASQNTLTLGMTGWF
jgi:hypothetical protein